MRRAFLLAQMLACWLVIYFAVGFVIATTSDDMSWAGYAVGGALGLVLMYGWTRLLISFLQRRHGPPTQIMEIGGMQVRAYFVETVTEVPGWHAPRLRRGDRLGEGSISREDGTAEPRRIIIVWSNHTNIVEGFDQPLVMTPGDTLDVNFTRDTSSGPRQAVLRVSRSVTRIYRSDP